MLLEQAAVHDDSKPGGFRPIGGLLVHDPFLHPDHLGPLGYGLLHDLRQELGAAKDVHDLHLVRDLRQGRVAALAEDLLAGGVDRDDPVAGPLQVGRDLETRLPRVRREPDHRDGVVFGDYFLDVSVCHGNPLNA